MTEVKFWEKKNWCEAHIEIDITSASLAMDLDELILKGAKDSVIREDWDRAADYINLHMALEKAIDGLNDEYKKTLIEAVKEEENGDDV